MANTDYLSGDTTVFSNLSLSGEARIRGLDLQASSLSGSRATIGSYLAIQNSAGTVDFGQANVLSFRTIAASALTASAGNTNVRDREIVLVAGGASGMSLAVYSNGTIYIFNSAVSAKAT
jgi:hypothetical protein